MCEEERRNVIKREKEFILQTMHLLLYMFNSTV